MLRLLGEVAPDSSRPAARRSGRDREGQRRSLITSRPGRFEGDCFYVWEEDADEARAWGSELAGGCSGARDRRGSDRWRRR